MSQILKAAPAESAALLEVSHLKVLFKKSRGLVRREQLDIKAVDDVSFELRESDIVSVV